MICWEETTKLGGKRTVQRCDELHRWLSLVVIEIGEKKLIKLMSEWEG